MTRHRRGLRLTGRETVRIAMAVKEDGTEQYAVPETSRGAKALPVVLVFKGATVGLLRRVFARIGGGVMFRSYSVELRWQPGMVNGVCPEYIEVVCREPDLYLAGLSEWLQLIATLLMRAVRCKITITTYEKFLNL